MDSQESAKRQSAAQKSAMIEAIDRLEAGLQQIETTEETVNRLIARIEKVLDGTKDDDVGAWVRTDIDRVLDGPWDRTDSVEPSPRKFAAAIGRKDLATDPMIRTDSAEPAWRKLRPATSDQRPFPGTTDDDDDWENAGQEASGYSPLERIRQNRALHAPQGLTKSQRRDYRRMVRLGEEDLELVQHELLTQAWSKPTKTKAKSYADIVSK